MSLLLPLLMYLHWRLSVRQSKEEQRKADSLKQKEEAELKQTIELSMKEANSLEESRKAVEHVSYRLIDRLM